MLGRRGWIWIAAVCIALAFTYTAVVHQPVDTLRETFRADSLKKKPGAGLPPAVLPGSSTAKDGLEDVLGPLREYEDGFTIVSPTYHRTEALPEYLDNYATGKLPSLKKIILIWNNEDDSPAWFNDTIKRYDVPIVLERRARNSKNERFRRTPEITTAAVLALDDDMVIQPRDVEYAFQAWQTYQYPRTRMVGYVRRRVNDEGQYRMSPDPQGYSMVLTKSAFIHVDWMDLWWQDSKLMSDFRNYVDSRKLPDEFPDLTTGCEDIAMSYLYAHHTHVPPFWVAGAKFHDIGHSKMDGISTQEGHNAARQACVQHFRDVFGVNTLVDTQMHAVLIQEADGGKTEDWV